jgi:hypothetical protein
MTCRAGHAAVFRDALVVGLVDALTGCYPVVHTLVCVRCPTILVEVYAIHRQTGLSRCMAHAAWHALTPRKEPGGMAERRLRLRLQQRPHLEADPAWATAVVEGVRIDDVVAFLRGWVDLETRQSTLAQEREGFLTAWRARSADQRRPQRLPVAARHADAPGHADLRQFLSGVHPPLPRGPRLRPAGSRGSREARSRGRPNGVGRGPP